jgi:hypothetical protein
LKEAQGRDRKKFRAPGLCLFGVDRENLGSVEFHLDGGGQCTTAQVTASVPASDIMNTGTVQVYVHTGGANSSAITFTIQ